MNAHAQARLILLQEWDPIGIADVPQAADEYDAYVATILRMLNDQSPQATLAAHLLSLEMQMGVAPSPQRAARVAALLSSAAERHWR